MSDRIPAHLFDEIDAAAARVDDLAAEGLEVHFEPAIGGGKPTIELRRLDGTVARELTALEAMEIMDGAELFQVS